jgi:hypothetical protein
MAKVHFFMNKINKLIFGKSHGLVAQALLNIEAVSK